MKTTRHAPRVNPPPTNGSLSAHVLQRMVDFVGRQGHDVDALCRSAGVDAGALRQPDARVSYAVSMRLCERALAVTGDDQFGLHLARGVGESLTRDPGTLLLMACATVRSALEAMVRVQRFWGDGPRSALVPVAGGACVRYELPGAIGALRRHSDECALAEMLIGMRHLTTRAVTPRAVRFRHGAPADTREHEALFGCAPTFDAPHTELELDDATLDLALPHAHATYRAVFEAQVESAMAKLPGDSAMVHAVRDVARAMLAVGCSLAGTARSLGVSTRTMQRRLRAEGTSFEAVLDDLRREVSMTLLARDVPAGEVALHVGYAEPSAFHHAFKRWTGTTSARARAARRDRT